MKHIINNKILASAVLALALVFVVGLAGASTAHAQYSSNIYGNGGYGNYGNSGSYGNSNNYGSYGNGYSNYGNGYSNYDNGGSYGSYGNSSNYGNSGNYGNSNNYGSYGNGYNNYGNSGNYNNSYSNYGNGGSYGNSGSYGNGYNNYGNGSGNYYGSGGYNGYNNYNYYSTPSYNYNHIPYNPPQQQYSPPIQASCYPTPLSIQSGQMAQWMTSVSGGNGVNNISWSGDEGLSGQGSSISKIYYSAGFKNASVTVRSAGQTVSANCSGSVNVKSNTAYYYNTPTYYSPM